MPYVAAQDGSQLYYKDWGSGPPVVLIHGWPLNADMWERQALFLAENGFRVVSYDRRGFGRSEQPWSGYDYDGLAADLSALIDALGLTQITLVGFSMGGGEVARYLAKMGASKVARGVLISAVTPFLLKTADNPDGVDACVFDAMTAGIRKDRARFFTDLAPSFYGVTPLDQRVSEAVLTWYVSMALTASPRATLECVRVFSSTDFRGDLAAIKTPMLVIHGSEDQTVPIVVAGPKTASLLPNARFIEYPGHAHGLTTSAADRLNQDLLAFIKGE